MNEITDEQYEAVVAVFGDDAAHGATSLANIVHILTAQGKADVATAIMHTFTAARGAGELPRIDWAQALMEDIDDIVPTVGMVQDGQALFYPALVNSLFGSDSVGKSLVLTQIAIDEVGKGGKVIWIDCEEPDQRPMVNRWQAMLGNGKALEPRVAAQFAEFEFFSFATGISADQINRLVEEAEDATMVVIDSVGEYLASRGGDENVDRDIASMVFQLLARPLAAMGPAVVLVDHVTKENNFGRSAAGSKRKRAGVTGAAFNLSLPAEDAAWSRDKPGYAVITCVKDKNGAHTKGQVSGYVEVIPLAEGNPLIVNIANHEPAIAVMIDSANPILQALEQMRDSGTFDPIVDIDDINRFLDKTDDGMPTGELRTLVTELVDRGKFKAQRNEHGNVQAIILEEPF